MSPLILGLAGLLLGLALGLGVGHLIRRRRAEAVGPQPARPADERTRQLAGLGKRIAEVAHEIGSPLTAILAFAEDLLRTEPSPEQREALLVIRHQAKRSRRMLQGLLDTVRGAAPNAERRLVDPAAVVHRVMPVFEREATERGLTLVTNVMADLPAVVGEEADLEQVLTNLLRNACQATPQGGRVSLAVQVRGRLLEFVIRDNGAGIPPEILPRIFEPFYTTKPADEGTGLGLAVAQDIVRRHRGILTAENVPEPEGGGARFVVSLPFEDRRWRDRDPGPETAEAPAVTPSPSRRLLLVEDEAPVRRAVGRFLVRHGWSVDEAADGRAALAALLPGEGSTPYDAVVCDLRLPGLSGMELYDRVVAETPALRSRLILVTGDIRSAEISRFLERTGATVLEKPYDLTALVALLDGLAH